MAGTAVLSALGFWQVQRLHWKESLISQVEARRLSEPLSLAQMEERWAKTGDVDYWPVKFQGIFDHSAEQYFYTTHKGKVGWNVYTPVDLDHGRKIFVNRGFVPDALRSPESRGDGQLSGKQEITGLARNPLAEKPNRFIPDNDLAENIYYWKSLDEMMQSAGLEADDLVPFFVDAGDSPVSGGWPLGGTTLISFSNNHLQYAVTWFGLALALLGVGGYFLYSYNYRKPT
ncbi:MAG: SURF1 family protein [Rhizobiaceae bacterium]